jgi:aspartyl-tRNA(Asn)/glutamyl-tRNA(Gln) amidotransferase subunit A
VFDYASIADYHHQLTAGKTSCVETVRHYLQSIREKSRLNAFLEVFEEEALSRAEQLDKQRLADEKLKALHGVVIGIKDVLCYKDHRLTAASLMLKDFVSIYSATAIQRLTDEDAIIIGRLNCDEFAMGSTNEHSAYGKVLNALDESRVPGGSSGGSAVAVQAGLCMVALGSDTGGSVRQPADFCGIIGFKPSYGLISRYGLVAYASSFDSVGIFARSIEDVAVLLSSIAGPDEYDSTVSGKAVPDYNASPDDHKYRFAYFPETLNHPSIDKEISAAIEREISSLKENGHAVDAVPFDLLDYIVPAYYVLTTAEASSNLSRYDGVRFGHRTAESDGDITTMYKRSRSEGFGAEVKRRIMLGTFVLSAGYYEAYFTRAQQVRQLLLQQIREVFEHYDFVIGPTSPFTALRFGDKINDPVAMYLADIYTVLANLTGMPAISLPIFTHSNGMPFSLQVMSNRFNEVSLLKASASLIAAAR